MTFPAAVDGADAPEIEVLQAPRWLLVRFGRPHAVASWAIVGGGLRQARAVAWHQVSERDLGPPVDARRFLRERLAEVGLARGAVGLLTSRALETYADVTCEHGGVTARCVATVGLGNALRAGDPPGPTGRIGTINVLCRLSVSLSAEALLEALALATEARTLAVREANVPSRVSGAPASGTGTDCVVIAAPAGRAGARYAGKHTPLGHLIGAAVYQATVQGIAR